MKKLLSLLLICAMIFPVPALSDAGAGKTLVFTFAGDCTIGSTELTRLNENSFDTAVIRNGFAYPFQHFRDFFGSDDCTVVNLEGVLTDSRAEENTQKVYRFRGPSSFVQVLTEASVEAVSLANNHVADYGAQGLRRTQETLDGAGIGRFRVREPWFFEKDGVRVAFFALDTTTINNNLHPVLDEMKRLKDSGEASAIVVCFHCGNEYDAMHNEAQGRMGERFVQYGADAVIMHHPHVVQGISIVNNRPVFYSLGNFVFGGNCEIRTEPYRTRSVTSLYSLVVRTEMHFSDEGVYLGQQTDVYPALISGDAPHNNYQPLFAAAEDAKEIMKAVQFDTAFPLPELTEKDGRVCMELPYLAAEKTE